MLLKVLFTLAVMLAVAVIFRVKNQPQKSSPSNAATDRSEGGVSSRAVIYTHTGSNHLDFNIGFRAALVRPAQDN